MKDQLTPKELDELLDLVLDFVPNSYKALARGMLWEKLNAENNNKTLIPKIRDLKNKFYWYSMETGI